MTQDLHATPYSFVNSTFTPTFILNKSSRPPEEKGIGCGDIKFKHRFRLAAERAVGP